MKAERDVLHGVAIVVDVDLIEGAGIEGKVIRAPIGVLQRVVIGDERDETLPSGLVAAEHVEVGAIYLGFSQNAGSLTVTGGHGRRGQNGAEQAKAQCGE